MGMLKKLFFLGLLMALVLPFVIKTRNGESIVTTQAVVGNMERPLETIKTELKKLASVTQGLGKVTSGDGKIADVGVNEGIKVYRWRDDNGNWQFSDQENPVGASDIMLVKMAVEADGVESKGAKASGGNNTDSDKGAMSAKPEDLEKSPLPFTVSAKELEKMIENAGDMQDFIDQYDQNLDTVGGQKNRR